MDKSLPASEGDMGSILVQEDPTCRGAASPSSRACQLQQLKAAYLEPKGCNEGSHSSEKSAHSHEEQPLLITAKD